MIHSMSGGVLTVNGEHDFAKVKLPDAPRWYLSAFGARAGDRVLVPVAEGTAEGVVERIERCTAQTAPVPLKRARSILAVLPKE